MISDDYKTETVQGLNAMGYEAGYIGDLRVGDEFTMMEKDHSENESRDLCDFFIVASMRDRKPDQTVVVFIAKNSAGITKHCAYGEAWGIYIKRR